jgi:hypothetical protein
LEFQLARFIRNGIAEDDAVSWIPESDGVEEGFGVGVGELELPVLAGVGGVVDAGLVAGTGGHKESFIGGESYDTSEIEAGGVGDLGGDPVASRIDRAKVGAASARGPRDFLRDGAYASE